MSAARQKDEAHVYPSGLTTGVSISRSLSTVYSGKATTGISSVSTCAREGAIRCNQAQAEPHSVAIKTT